MTAKPLPPLETLHKLFTCDFNAGKLFWRDRPENMFKSGNIGAIANMKRWNARYANQECFTKSNHSGYLKGIIDGKEYLTHRIIWAMYIGSDFDGEIDHINHDRADNRIVNLRVVTHRQNSRNQKLRATNTSGVVGVGWHKAKGKWRATIQAEGANKHLGLFDTIEEATEVRKSAEIKYGFHENHGMEAAA